MDLNLDVRKRAKALFFCGYLTNPVGDLNLI